MNPLALAMAAAAFLAGEPGPAELIVFLGSADRVEREEAARTLEELGPEALPALRDAGKAGPGEVPKRASGLARAIEGRLLEKPTLVEFDFDGLPLDEATRALAARSGHALVLDPGNDPGLPLRPIRAKSPAPVPFWEALDLLGRAGHVRHDPGARPEKPSHLAVLHLADGEPPASTLYRGPFRVHLLGLHARRDLDLRGNPPGRARASRGTLYVELQAFAEPGRSIDPDGMPSLGATDDQGRPVPPPPVDAEWPRPPRGSWIAPGAPSLLQWRLPLGLPGPGAASLRRLGGKMPVVVSARRPDPLVIPLDDAPGKSYRHEEATIRFRIVQDAGKNHFQVEITLTPDPAPAGSRADRGPALPLDQFAFEDRDGHPLPWLPMNQGPAQGGETRLQVLISGGERPIRLLHHGLIRASTEIPFEFVDVPLP